MVRIIPFVGTVITLLSVGGLFFYVAPETGRDGMEEFVSCLRSPSETDGHLELLDQQPCPDEYVCHSLLFVGL
jgi:hypothetical protein